MWIMAIGGGAFLATLAGGLLALRLRDKLHLILGFSAGAVIGVAFFDLLPEALELGGATHRPAVLFSCTALGFLAYLIVDRVMARGRAGADNHGHDNPPVIATRRDIIGAGSLSAHSLLDGVAIGLAFQTSNAVGAIVAIAVLTHDFSDGVNTMNIVLKNGGSRRRALAWLLADAIAPALGIIATFFFTLTAAVLGLVLASFAGFFLYIGASDLIPESYHSHPKFLTTLMTLLGAAVLYAATMIAEGR
jgi:ZIP family zinc transporter